MTGRLTHRVAALVDDACDTAGVHPALLQGSYSGGVGASAGTHAGGGAFDLDARHLTTGAALRLVDELRRRNVAAWLRTPQYGYRTTAQSPPHIHGIVKDEPDLSPAARAQVADYDAGRNGLADRGRDPHPRPPQHPYRQPTTPPPPVARPQEDDMPQLLIKGDRSPEVYSLNTQTGRRRPVPLPEYLARTAHHEHETVMPQEQFDAIPKEQ